MPLATVYCMTLVMRCKKNIDSSGVFNPHSFGLGKLPSGTNCFSLRLQFWTQVSLDSRGSGENEIGLWKDVGNCFTSF